MFKDMHLDLSIGLVCNITSWVMNAEHNISSTFLCYFSKVCNFSKSGGHSNSNNSVDLSTQVVVSIC